MIFGVEDFVMNVVCWYRDVCIVLRFVGNLPQRFEDFVEVGTIWGTMWNLIFGCPAAL